jgi:hypothetical protein
MNRPALRRAAPWCLALCAFVAHALQSGTTPQGLAYVTGGVSQEELQSLRARRDDYDLWVITAASKSGAYLSDVLVTIRDASKRIVFNRRLEGPWLFIDLPLGSYEVEAALNGQAETRRTTIHQGDRHQAIFYFDTGDAVIEPKPSSAARSPGPAATTKP